MAVTDINSLNEELNKIGAASVTTPRIMQLIGGPPCLFWGPPGIGKTQGLTAAVRGYFNDIFDNQGTFSDPEERKLELASRLEILIASIREPTDFGGLPIPDEVGSYTLAAPQWALDLKRIGDENDDMPVAAVLYLDEISTAPPAVQAALLRVVLDREVGDLTLPENIWICAAANPPEMAAGGWEIAPPLANRFLHFWWGIDTEEWTQGVIDRWGKGWVTQYEKPSDRIVRLKKDISTMVSAFIARNPRQLFGMPAKKDRKEQLAWPSPRSWEHAIKMMAQLGGYKETKGGESGAFSETEADTSGVDNIEGPWMLLKASVGTEAATLFNVFRKYFHVLPEPGEILDNPDSVPDILKGHQQDVAFALAQMIVTVFADPQRGYMTGQTKDKYWKNIWKALLHAASPAPGVRYAGMIGGPVKILIDRIDWDLPEDIEEKVYAEWGEVLDLD
jgi:hypothetical protein